MNISGGISKPLKPYEKIIFHKVFSKLQRHLQALLDIHWLLLCLTLLLQFAASPPRISLKCSTKALFMSFGM